MGLEYRTAGNMYFVCRRGLYQVCRKHRTSYVVPYQVCEYKLVCIDAVCAILPAKSFIYLCSGVNTCTYSMVCTVDSLIDVPCNRG